MVKKLKSERIKGKKFCKRAITYIEKLFMRMKNYSQVFIIKLTNNLYVSSYFMSVLAIKMIANNAMTK